MIEIDIRVQGEDLFLKVYFDILIMGVLGIQLNSSDPLTKTRLVLREMSISQHCSKWSWCLDLVQIASFASPFYFPCPQV